MDLGKVSTIAGNIMMRAIKKTNELLGPNDAELRCQFYDIYDDARVLQRYALLIDRELIREHFHKSYKIKCGRWQGAGELAKELENVYSAALV